MDFPAALTHTRPLKAVECALSVWFPNQTMKVETWSRFPTYSALEVPLDPTVQKPSANVLRFKIPAEPAK